MRTMTKQFFLGVAVVGSLVAGAVGTAQATLAVHGPYTWTASSWPTPKSTGYKASNAYCWLGGFDVGSTQKTVDQAYVYLDKSGNWMVSGAGKDAATKPSSSTFATAYCADLKSGTDTLFMPSNGTIVQVACPSLSDHTLGGSCYSATNGTASSVKNYTWTASPTGSNPNFKDNEWTNTYASIQGIGYDGKSEGGQILQATVAPPGWNPDGREIYHETPIQTWIQNLASTTDMQVAYGAIWPESDVHWFCAAGLDSDCYGALSSARNGQGAVTLTDEWGNPITANSKGGDNYLCSLDYVQTGGTDGEISAKLTINSSSQWQLTVTGPAAGVTSATAFCIPYPWYVTSP
jgi:hypothetical protein